MKRIFLFVLIGFIGGTDPQAGYSQSVVVDDFESYNAGGLPTRWKFVSKDETVYPVQKTMDGREKATIAEEDGNQFARAYTNGEALRISLLNDKSYTWSLEQHPRLRWEWRALQLPEGASEKGTNDTGGALYITFNDKDWLGRPKSIKYTYSSTLPVGTTISFGSLKAIVVSSGADGHGDWTTVTRNVRKDYQRLFDSSPPEVVGITLWSDSDSTKDTAQVDFDNITLLPSKQSGATGKQENEQ